MAARRRTVEECGMRRLPATFNPNMVEFMEPFLAVSGEWKAYEIRGTSRIGSETRQFNFYAINIEAGGYCTFSIEPQTDEENDPTQPEPLAYRDTIIDNFAAEGGDPAEMKILGTRSITNGVARDSIEKEFNMNQKDHTKQGSVRLASREASFNDCAIFEPFAEDHNCFDKKCGQTIGLSEVSAYILLSDGLNPEETENQVDSPAYHLITLFEPPRQKGLAVADDPETRKAKEASMQNAIDLIGDAIAPLKIAKKGRDGDQCIRDAIKVLDEAIRQLDLSIT